MAKQVTSSRDKTRRRRKVGAPVRVITPEPRRQVRASRRAYFELYAPRLTLNPWKNATEWRASRPKFFAGVLMVVLAIALFQLFGVSTFFVDGVNWTGNRYMSANELTQASGVLGWNIFFVDPQEIQANLKKLPEIQDARVSLALPNTVNVQVTERAPSFVWQTGNATYWVDQEGIAFQARANLNGIMWVKDLDSMPVKLGARVNADAFNAAVGLHNAWPDGPQAFEWSDAHGLAVRDQHGWLIYFGRAIQMANKLTELQIISTQIVKENRSITFIDLGSGLPYFQEVTAQATKKP
ncbi:MAG: FtsQ-type POTRA domain-containing protein [Anaerolineae bacterium]